MTSFEPIQPGEKCSAMVTDKVDGSRRRCINWPVSGCTVCRMHGAGAPQVKAAAARRIRAQKAAMHVSKFALPVDVTHSEALVGEMQLAQGVVNWLSALVNSFESADELKQRDVTGRFEKPSVWVEMLGNERDRLLRAAKACADVGIEEKWINLQREQGEQLASIIGGVLADVFRELLSSPDLSVEVAVRIQREVVPEILRRRLTEIGGMA